MKLLITAFLALIATSLAYVDSDIVSAKIESCRGCSLNRLPEVKKFVLDDAPKYERVQVNFITGAPPELILLDKTDQELERIALSKLNRDECNDLLMRKGFKKNEKNSEL